MPPLPSSTSAAFTLRPYWTPPPQPSPSAAAFIQRRIQLADEVPLPLLVASAAFTLKSVPPSPKGLKGFRKIGVDHQWEYMNSNFQAGKQHLLSNMRRRSEQQPTLQRGRRNKSSSLNPEMLMNAINESRVEMNKLKVQQVDMDFHIMELQEEAKNAAEASKKLTMLFAKTCEIIAKRGREDDDDDEGVIKRKKVVEPERAESPTMNNDTDLYLDAPLSEVQLVSSEDDHAFKSKPETIPENYSNDVKIWEMILLGDDEDGEVGVTKNDQD